VVIERGAVVQVPEVMSIDNGAVLECILEALDRLGYTVCIRKVQKS
jgi:site-specific DNA-cytosine methylase